MWRSMACLLLLLSASWLGCAHKENPHADSIPKIPPGRGAVGPEAGEQLPVAPPGR